MDWRYPLHSQMVTARLNYFSYEDDIPVNSFHTIDAQGGWKQLGAGKLNFLVRAMYQGKSYRETGPQEYSSFTIQGGGDYRNISGTSYDFLLSNRYQTSEDMGLNFNVASANINYFPNESFSIHAQYEGYATLADTGASFLNYHRPNVELRFKKLGGITDYGVRVNYRYHPDANTLTYGQVYLFMGHKEPSTEGTNWNLVGRYQLNNGLFNPDFIQTNFDLSSITKNLYVGFNSVMRYVLSASDDSISMHFTDLNVNPGVIITFNQVRINIGPTLGATMYLYNQSPSLKDNLNNSARAGILINAMASIASWINIRAWSEYERTFQFNEDPYINRKREPTRFRIGGEINVQILRQLSLFLYAQTYSINNDTGVKIYLPSGEKDRDIIKDTNIYFGTRYSL
ncbi:MAG: hypothetical protein GXO82_04165 [Chlorobi bacterium]|nr:hypothetical protein [Chlorobiota bacterium]